MLDSPKKKVKFQIQINQEGCSLDHRNIQTIECWMPAVEATQDPELDHLRALNFDLNREVFKLRGVNETLKGQNERFRMERDQANESLRKIEEIITPF